MKRTSKWIGAVATAAMSLTLVAPRAGATAKPTATSTQTTSGTTTPTLTKVRLSLSSTSDWAVVSVVGTTVSVRQQDTTSGPASIQSKGDGFEVDGGSATAPVAATFDMVLWVPTTAMPALQIIKGAAGSAQATLSRIDTGGLVSVANLTDSLSVDALNLASTPVSSTTLIGRGVSAPAADPRPLTMAFYYPWFGAGFWNNGVNQWIDIPTSAYDTTSSSAVNQQVRQAKSNGLTGFVTSFDGHHDSGFDLVLSAASQVGGFSSAPLIELTQAQIDCGGTQCVSVVEQDLRDALSRSGQSSYLKSADGRPVVFMFGSWTLTPALWATVTQDLAASGLHPFVVADNADPAWGFDGFFWYSPNGFTAPDLATADRNDGWNMHLSQLINPSAKERLWAATVSPGQDDHLIRTPSTVQARLGGQRYTDTWNAAMSTQPSSAPDWVLVTSWNEWYENTNIAPDNVNGSTALQQTASFSTTFKNTPR